MTTNEQQSNKTLEPTSIVDSSPWGSNQSSSGKGLDTVEVIGSIPVAPIGFSIANQQFTSIDIPSGSVFLAS